MNKQIIIVLLAVILIGGGAYYFGLSKSKIASDGHADHTHDPIVAPIGGIVPMDHGNVTMMATGAKPAGTRVIVKNTTYKSGTQIFSFELYGKDGDVWSDKDLKIAHEKKMHFILVSNDFSKYQHVHPEFKDNLWQVSVTLNTNTGYQAYVDIESNEDGAETLRLPIVVGTPTAGAKVSQKEITLIKDGVQVKMNALNGFIAGKENEVSFAISQNGKTITPENYLGAKGHIVALGDDPNTFIHGHPSEGGHTEVDFAFAFDKVGAYTLFAQFKVDGVVRTYPFTITVTKGSGTASMPIDESQPHSH